MQNYSLPIYTKKHATVLCWLLIIIDCIYRVVLWLADRALFIDEANLARNIFDNDLFGLAKPLKYGQYAPPVFLWITKINVFIFNYDEKILRLYPLFAGIVSIILLFQLLKEFISVKYVWYPLCLFATGAIYLRYSTEFKQYIPDAMFSLVLINMALNINIDKTRNIIFFVFWFLLGSIAIWSSMPSIFILTAIGLYYFINVLIHKDLLKLTLLILLGCIWLLQFGYYYLNILAPQAGSDYLQNFHKWYFVDAFPTNFDDFKNHNWLLLKGLTEALGGKIATSLILNLFLTVAGAYVFIKSKNIKGVLFLIPPILIYITSSLKSYSVMERLMLFYMPMWLLLIGIGFEFIIIRSHKLIKYFIVIIAVIGAFKFNKISYITTKPLYLENIPKCLDFLVDNEISSKDLYLTNLAEGGYIYYTEIHPEKDRWKTLRNGHQLKWDTDFKEHFNISGQRASLLITSVGINGKNEIIELIKNHNNINENIDAADAHAVIFTHK